MKKRKLDYFQPDNGSNLISHRFTAGGPSEPLLGGAQQEQHGRIDVRNRQVAKLLVAGFILLGVGKSFNVNVLEAASIYMFLCALAVHRGWVNN